MNHDEPRGDSLPKPALSEAEGAVRRAMLVAVRARASSLVRQEREGMASAMPKSTDPNPSADEAQLFEPGAQVWRGRPRPRMYEPPPAPHPCHLERSGIGRSRPIPRSRKIPTRTTTPCWADTPSRQKAARVPRFLRALCARGGRGSAQPPPR